MKDIQRHKVFTIKEDTLVEEYYDMSKPVEVWDLNQLVLIADRRVLRTNSKETDIVQFQNSKALVGLIFADNQFLNVELAPEEYTLLNTKATLNQAKLSSSDIKPAKSSKTLSDKEKKHIKQKNNLDTLVAILGVCIMLGAIYSLIPLLFMNEASTTDINSFKDAMTYIVISLVSVGGLALVIQLWDTP